MNDLQKMAARMDVIIKLLVEIGLKTGGIDEKLLQEANSMLGEDYELRKV